MNYGNDDFRVEINDGIQCEPQDIYDAATVAQNNAAGVPLTYVCPTTEVVSKITMKATTFAINEVTLENTDGCTPAELKLTNKQGEHFKRERESFKTVLKRNMEWE